MAGILHVCRANRARSALAELATRELLARHGLDGVVSVGGAGTWTPGGEAMWPPAAHEALRWGWDPSSVRSRGLTVPLVREADLILAATRELRDEVIAQAPFAVRRTFTWLELAWLIGGLGPAGLFDELEALAPQQRLAVLPSLLGRVRGRLSVPPGSSFDVLDPVDCPADYLPGATQQIQRCVAVLVGVLAGQPV